MFGVFFSISTKYLFFLSVEHDFLFLFLVIESATVLFYDYHLLPLCDS